MKGAMSRNLYLLAASLLLFSLVSCGMSLVPNALQPGLPAQRLLVEDDRPGSPSDLSRSPPSPGY